MIYYKEFAEKGCFTFEDAVRIIGAESKTYQVLHEYIDDGYICKIRRGLYTAINIFDNIPIANRFVVGSSISETSYISHHSAFEYYGCANQLYNIVYVSSNERFNEFSFDDYDFVRIKPSIDLGIETIKGVTLTDLERTVLDGINDFEKTMDFEELIQCIYLVPNLNEDKLVKYLEKYDKQFLYQKTGFILEHLKEEFNISNEFLDFCKGKIGKSSRYLSCEKRRWHIDFSAKWHLSVPENIWEKVGY